MSDNYVPDWSALPPEVQTILQKDPKQYTYQDAEVLQRFLITQGAYLDPIMANIIGSAIGAAHSLPPPPTPTGNDIFLNPPPADLASQTQTPVPQAPEVQTQIPQRGQGMGDLGPVITQPGVGSVGPTDWGAEAGALGPTQSPDVSRDTAPTPSLQGAPVAPAPRQFPGGPTLPFPKGPPVGFEGSGPGLPSMAGRQEFGLGLPRVKRGFEQEQRREERGKTRPEDWKARARGLSFGLDPESAFFGMAPGSARDYADDAYLAAYAMSGQNPQTAGMMMPQVQEALGLAQAGLLSSRGTKKGLGGPDAAAAQLALAENFMQEMQPGDFVDPHRTYRKTFKRAENTPIEKLHNEGGPGGTPGEQIAVTNNSLIATTANAMTQQSAENLAAQLNRAGMDWLIAVSKGETMTYPQYLRSIGAQHWVSKSIV